VSTLHHSLPDLVFKSIAEESGMGWHYQSARALKNYGDYAAVCVRPSQGLRWISKLVDGVPVVLAPMIRLSPSKRLWKWSEVSPWLANYVAELSTKHGYVPYIHEYRALNSELIVRRLLGEEVPMVLQHHGSAPPRLKFSSSFGLVKDLSKIRRERLLNKVRGAIFVLNEAEKEYLEDCLAVEATVKVRTMAIDFNRLKPVSDEERMELKRSLKLPEDAVVLCTYVGVFREEFSTVKGAHLIAKIWKHVRSEVNERSAMIVTGLGENVVNDMRRLGIKAYSFLPPEEYLRLVKASDVYFLPATSAYYYGGIGVAIMEALALGKPVVSPTLIHLPERECIKHVGFLTPFVDDERALKIFVEGLEYVMRNLSSFKAERIRQIAYKYYSWQSFVSDFRGALKGF